MTNRFDRSLGPDFENDLKEGCLKPLLDVARCDRDLIFECRGTYATIYCKGQQLVRIDSAGTGGYQLTSDPAFWSKQREKVSSAAETTEFVEAVLPFIKQAIAMHRGKGGLEIEYEQFLIRTNNNEPALNTDYFAVDRQGVIGEGLGRLDVLGVYWPGPLRQTAADLPVALIEVKFSLTGGVETIAAQVASYYDSLEANIEPVAAGLQNLLRQKLRLKLITGASADALAKLERLTVSPDINRARVALALVDYSPRSTRLKLASLGNLRFADRIDVFRLGLGMWTANSVGTPPAAAVEPADL